MNYPRHNNENKVHQKDRKSQKCVFSSHST